MMGIAWFQTHFYRINELMSEGGIVMAPLIVISMVMWLLIGFVINHIYSAWLMDVKERNGTISGIFSGYRFIEPKDL